MQYATDLPVVLVGLHLLGAALVWVAVLRLLLSLRERGLPPVVATTAETATDAATADEAQARVPGPATAAAPAPVADEERDRPEAVPQRP